MLSLADTATMNREFSSYPRRGEPVPVKSVPARLEPFGDKGWGVVDYDSAREAAWFVLNYGAAAMPCWQRLEVIDGELFRVR